MTFSRTAHHASIVEKSFDAQGVRLNYAEGPKHGPPLVLLHGLGRHWQSFESLIPGLSRKWHIYALDFRGHGKSARVRGKYHGLDYAADIVAFLQAHMQQPAVLFGHSLGGMVSMWVASHQPELVRAAVLGDNAIAIRHRSTTGIFTGLFRGLWQLALRGGTLDEIARGIAAIPVMLPGADTPICIGDLPGNNHQYLLGWAQCVSQVDPEVYRMAIDGSAHEGWDGEGLLRGMKCPTLLLQANPQLGGLMSDADVELAMRTLAHPVHVKLERLSHALHIQRPDPVLRAVTHFLDQLAEAD